MATHSLLRAFKSNEPAFGAWVILPGAFNARTVARSSPNLSWIVIDCEHGLTSLQPGTAKSIQAIQGIGAGAPSSIVRIPATGISAETGWQIKYALDAGARGILVPMVSTAANAKEIVADCRFPPVGRRGFGSPFTPANWGVSASEYLKSADENILVMVQIETKEGVDNVQAMAETPGIDVLFIGPYDLSMSLGYPLPSPDPHPAVESVIHSILQATHNSKKKCAIFCSSGEQAANRAAQGFDMINVTSDVGAMSEAIAKHLAIASGI